jgi:hypothetical protein
MILLNKDSNLTPGYLLAAANGSLAAPDHGRETATPGVVNMKIICRFIRKQPLNQRFKLLAVNDIGVKHYAGSIECANGQQPLGENFGNLARSKPGLSGPLANENGMARAIRRIRRLMLVVHEQ